MGYLRYARPAIIVLLVLWFIFIIHPFTKEGVVITSSEMPASLVLKKGDIIVGINGNPIHNLEDYKNAVAQIKPNDTVTVNALRETFPYSYRDITHVFVAEERNNETYLGLYVDNTHFSNLKLSYTLAGGHKIVLKSNQSNAVQVLDERLKFGKISDYSIKKEGENIVIYTSNPVEEILPLIKTKGEIVAKIGNQTFFTSKDIENVCITGVNCILNLYGHYNESATEKSVVWRYGFEVDITREAGERFVNLTNNLTISSCKFDKCMLNESIDYYIDGVLIGSEPIYSDSKGMPYQRVVVGGDVATKDDAMKLLYFTQAIVKGGELNAEIVSVSDYHPKSTFLVDILSYFLIIVGIAAALTSFFFLRKVKILLGMLWISFSEIIMVLGTLAGLNIIVTFSTLISLILVGLIIIGIYGYISFVFKKEGIIKSKITVLSKELTKWGVISIIVLFLFVFLAPQFISPILTYAVINTVLTRQMFMRIIEKE